MEGKLEIFFTDHQVEYIVTASFRGLKIHAQQAYSKMHEYVPCVYVYYQTCLV